jgi:hypothetical protein
MWKWFAAKVSADTPSFMADAWRCEPVDVDGGTAAELGDDAAVLLPLASAAKVLMLLLVQVRRKLLHGASSHSIREARRAANHDEWRYIVVINQT